MNRFVLHSIYCILFIMFTIGFMQYEYNALIRGFKLHSTPPPIPSYLRPIYSSPTPLLSLPIPDRYIVPLPPHSYTFLYQTDNIVPLLPPHIPSYTKPIYSSLTPTHCSGSWYPTFNLLRALITNLEPAQNLDSQPWTCSGPW